MRSKRATCRDCRKPLDSENTTYCRECAAKRAVERRRKGPFAERWHEILYVMEDVLRREQYSTGLVSGVRFVRLSQVKRIALLSSVALHLWPRSKYESLLAELVDAPVDGLLGVYNHRGLSRESIATYSVGFERDLKRVTRDRLGFIIVDDTD